ncbi:MAG: hypothetical protein MUC96_07445 [Myxococcaceae bacterium]|jgi:hypothetical protein|nr:hypothetical protein [Myxococcaceae bacterium]
MCRLTLVVMSLVVSLGCVAADERGCVKQSVAQCEQRFMCVRVDGGASEFGYEVGPSRTFVSCEVEAATCEARALEQCARP